MDPSKFSLRERQSLMRMYTLEMAKWNFIGASIDVPGPDLGTGTREMNWMKDSYMQYYGNKDVNAQACCTGKSESQGGIAGRTESTGLGVFLCIKDLLDNEWLMNKHNISKGLKDKTFIVQVKILILFYYIFINYFVLIFFIKEYKNVYNQS